MLNLLFKYISFINTIMGEGALRSMGYSNKQLAILFYMICIPLRFSFPIIASKAKNVPILKVIMVLAGLIAAGINTSRIGAGTWWHTKVHIATSIAIVLSLLIPGPIKPEYILLFDVLYGVSSSLFIRPFPSKCPFS
jgi:hypothetical protein